jgi:hypothetical protein
MNRKAKRRYQGKAGPLTDDQVFYYLNGFCLDGHKPDFHHPRVGGVLPLDCPFETPETMQQAWAANREAIIPKAPPFMRPWGWWQHDAPEPRRRTPMLYGFRSDRGHTYYPIGSTGVWSATGHPETEVIEDERDYLVRLGLLNEAERKLLEVESNDAQKEESGTETEAAPLSEMR